ncbi:hypothetical protein BSKO_03268 [Bryopsis sp. KO-2023]|nr:hypothetical protein BSKO_03268 [Bryopsis sp. KO-2023]
MVHKAIAAFAFLAAILSVATPAMGVKSSRSLLCSSCFSDCASCDDDYCADCGCDGHCNYCLDGYEFGEDGYCCEIWHEPSHPKPSKKVHYEEPVHYVEPAPKPVYIKKGKGGGGQATADADAWGGSTKTKTSTNCDGYGCHSSSSSSSRSG